MSLIQTWLQGIKCGLCFAVLLLSPLASLAAPKLATIQVKVDGLNNNQGVVRIAMFNSPQAFAEKNNNAPDAFQKGVATINGNNQAIFTFKDVPYGPYAIKLFHDADNSGQLKKNLFGKPKEGFGFSNNPSITNKAPAFDQAKFIVDQPKVAVAIHIINP